MKQRDNDLGCLAVVFAWCMIAAVITLGIENDKLERRVSDLENKPCLMTGAHTGCEKVGRDE